MMPISQTLLKTVGKEDMYCPRSMKVKFLDGMESVPSESMLKGLYFETMCIGAGRGGKQVKDLPRLKNGNKSADQRRIDEQVEKFKQVSLAYNLNTREVQFTLSAEINGVLYEGNADVIGSLDIPGEGHVEHAIIDLKLTGSIYSTYGDFCWGFPANMDHTQAVMYSRIYTAQFGVKPRFFYMVFDYKPVPEYKIIEKEVKSIDDFEMDEKIRISTDRMKRDLGNNFPTRPSYENCRWCPLQDTCPENTIAKTIEKV